MSGKTVWNVSGGQDLAQPRLQLAAVFFYVRKRIRFIENFECLFCSRERYRVTGERTAVNDALTDFPHYLFASRHHR